MEDEKVNLVRRSSGGGAVYQDLGNSIFSFLTPKHDSNTINENNFIITNALGNYTLYLYYNIIILLNLYLLNIILASFGINATPTGRNDIEVGGYKISGAAFRHSKGRSLHHGTLLLNVEMKALDRYLTPNKLKMQSKGNDYIYYKLFLSFIFII
jgi:lipoate-protein ligase A